MASTPPSARTTAIEREADGPPALPAQRAWAYWITYAGSWALYRAVFRMRAHGARNVPREGGVVLASLHRSNFDTFLIGVPLPWRKLRPMAKIELYGNPLMGWVLDACGAFPVRRGTSDRDAIRAALSILRAGGTVAMYPEGTRNRSGTARVHTGAARLALQSGAALVPVALSGTDRVRAWPPRIPRFEIAYGSPIPLDDLRSLDVRAAAEQATERWKQAVGELRGRLSG